MFQRLENENITDLEQCGRNGFLYFSHNIFNQILGYEWPSNDVGSVEM